MKIKSVSKEQLENMSYNDMAYLALKEKGKKMKTIDIFKTINESLGYKDSDYEDKIADFFTLLATEKRFIQLPKGYWDLKENHSVNNPEEDEEETEEDIEIEEVAEEDEEETEMFDDEENDNDTIDDGLKDLVVIDEIEEEAE